ncbi:large subunit ribosomal protein L30 [Spirosoma lacussanchae]|uniref:Large ribosomal subunit protein uL30 n=1 Tax=Spirosoma sordidisoli TaxID=2502893 RepID=A0A4Q2UNA1_9BACT|nr:MULTISPECIES: 50S ribosomal protein L30 [Spirosoma]RYC69241.1 50S ribosomal protein L30 [Spirosoma sordidisoli]
MARVRITQIRSTIKRPQTQKNAIKSLGLGKINRSVEVEFNDAMKGAINKVQHLVRVEEI